MIYCRLPTLFPFSLFSVESVPLVCGDHAVRAESASGVAGGCCSSTFGAAKGGKERLSQISPAAPEKNSGATGEKLRRRRRKSPVPLESNLRGLRWHHQRPLRGVKAGLSAIGGGAWRCGRRMAGSSMLVVSFVNAHVFFLYEKFVKRWFAVEKFIQLSLFNTKCLLYLRKFRRFAAAREGE